MNSKPRTDDRHYLVRNGKVCGIVTKEHEQRKQIQANERMKDVSD
jgi:hypothetical protein